MVPLVQFLLTLDKVILGWLDQLGLVKLQWTVIAWARSLGLLTDGPHESEGHPCYL